MTQWDFPPWICSCNTPHPFLSMSSPWYSNDSHSCKNFQPELLKKAKNKTKKTAYGLFTKLCNAKRGGHREAIVEGEDGMWQSRYLLCILTSEHLFLHAFAWSKIINKLLVSQLIICTTACNLLFKAMQLKYCSTYYRDIVTRVVYLDQL